MHTAELEQRRKEKKLDPRQLLCHNRTMQLNPGLGRPISNPKHLPLAQRN